MGRLTAYVPDTAIGRLAADLHVDFWSIDADQNPRLLRAWKISARAVSRPKALVPRNALAAMNDRHPFALPLGRRLGGRPGGGASLLGASPLVQEDAPRRDVSDGGEVLVARRTVSKPHTLLRSASLGRVGPESPTLRMTCLEFLRLRQGREQSCAS
jgi:hypothetical protein